jgi:hypothetical protein
MDTSAMTQYRALMKEIKLRINVIDHLHSGRGNSLYVPTTTESMCLQIRKVLELIAFGSLIANKDLYAKVYANFAKSWNAKLLLKDLRRLNQNFYPRAIHEVQPDPPDIGDHFIDRNDALTQDEFIKIYDKCGAIMHADNPFGSKVDYTYYRDSILVWLEKIMHLLNSHAVRLVDDSHFYLVHMKEDGHDEVSVYKFQIVQEN